MIAAGIESLLIFLVFIVLSALSTWLQKKRQSEEETVEWPPQNEPGHPPRVPGRGPAPPPRRVTPGPAPLRNWEEELRRLLQGETPEPPKTVPPPVPVPPPVRARPVVSDAYSRRPPPQPTSSLSVPGPEHGSAEVAGAARLEDSEQAYRKARRVQAEAAKRLRDAQARTSLHKQAYALVQRAGKPDIRAARALLSNPGAARQAIIASVVLGTPKAFEE